MRIPEKSRTRSPASSSLNLKVSISYHVNQKLFSISLPASSKAQELHRFTSVPIGLQNHSILSKQASLLFSVSLVVNGTVNWIVGCRRT